MDWMLKILLGSIPSMAGPGSALSAITTPLTEYVKPEYISKYSHVIHKSKLEKTAKEVLNVMVLRFNINGEKQGNGQSAIAKWYHGYQKV